MVKQINEERLISLFKTLVETDSPSCNEREICDILKNELLAIGIEAIEDNAGEHINGNAGNLYAYIDGDIDLEPILFSAHMDTVEPSRNKKCIYSKFMNICSKFSFNFCTKVGVIPKISANPCTAISYKNPHEI